MRALHSYSFIRGKVQSFSFSVQNIQNRLEINSDLQLRKQVLIFLSVLVFSKTELYDMCWDLKDGFKDCLVAAAPYGGPIGIHSFTGNCYLLLIYMLMSFVNYLYRFSIFSTALLRKPLRCSPSSRPQLEIYSASGFVITSFPVDNYQIELPINPHQL